MAVSQIRGAAICFRMIIHRTVKFSAAASFIKALFDFGEYLISWYGLYNFYPGFINFIAIIQRSEIIKRRADIGASGDAGNECHQFSAGERPMNKQHRALFLSHGGGPLPLLGDQSHLEMVARLHDLAAAIARPSAIIVVSAHWEAHRPAVTSAARPALIYDYYGFPKESYAITYPCPGAPQLAQAISRALGAAGITADLDAARGVDHGLFVPLKIMYPAADIPCVQLSLVRGLDPAGHLALGKALRSLGDQSLLLIGSGFSFHNMQAFFAPETDEARAMNHSFERWLLETCSDRNLSEEEREQRLINWEAAPFARYCHPREEHLLPLHVCYGFAAAACSNSYELQILNKKSSMYLWEI